MGGPDGRIKWRIIGTKIIFKIKANVSRYDSWEQESLLRGFVTVCCACHLCCPPGITFCYSVNHSWNSTRKIEVDLKEEEKEITISLIVFE